MGMAHSSHGSALGRNAGASSAGTRAGVLTDFGSDQEAPTVRSTATNKQRVGRSPNRMGNSRQSRPGRLRIPRTDLVGRYSLYCTRRRKV